MNAKKLTVEQMGWLVKAGISYGMDAQGREVFARGHFEAAAHADGVWGIWDTAARVWTEDILTADGSPWECRCLEVTHPDLKRALADLATR
jgi:hypothetical protein